jgi:syntaxin 1B/2/3
MAPAETHMAVPTHMAARTRTAPTMDNSQFVSQDPVRRMRNLLTNRQQHQQQPSTRLNAPELPHQHSTYSQQTQDSTYSQQGDGAYVTSANAPPLPPVPQGQVEYVQPSRNTLSNPDFLSRVEAVKADIRTLTTHVGQIATLHQQSISSADNVGSSNALESMVTQTQVLNTSIKDQIKYLETDAARSQGNTVKDTQIRQLKTSFTKQLQEYRQEEANYERRYREQIARQYRIVNPEATDSEVQEAMGADWGNEGVFQTAVSQPSDLGLRSRT